MLKELLTPEQLKKIENVLMPVEKIALEDLNLPYEVRGSIDHAIIVKNRIVQFCSEDYGLRTNEEILDNFLEFLISNKVPISEINGINHRNSRFRMDIIIGDKSENISKKVIDPVKMGLRIYNSYDGSQKFMFSAGIYRLVCLNGLSVLDETFSMKKTHTMQIYDGVDLSESLAKIAMVMEQFNDMTALYHDLSNFKVYSLETRMREVIEATNYPVSLLDGALERAQLELELGYPKSDWVVYNGLNFMLNHGNDSYLGRKFEKMDREILKFLLEC